ncbi:MAG TPA: hypothetical protein VMU09_05345, partial [Acidimicrobiales bacterium]|nr:hypothetical protein [Acidimicrobiales bacterium]
MSNDQPVPYYLRPDRTKLSETAHDEDSLEPHPSGDPGTRTEGPVEYPVASQAPPGAATKGDEPVLVGAPPADPMTRQAPPLSWPRPAPPPQAAGNDSTLLRTAPAYDGPRAAAFPA